MTGDREWTRLEVDPATATFPASATYAGAPIWVFRTGAGYRGIQELCPHDYRSFENATLVGGGSMVRCTYHSFTFKLDSGTGVNCPGDRIDVYEIVERDGALFARAAAEPA